MKGMKEEEEAKRHANEQRLRRAVFDAIVTLSDNVDEITLQQKLNSLDQSSWMEVIEERYLGRMCGFPLCNNPVEIKHSQKYRIDLKRKKVFERSAEVDKFCSHYCFLRSATVKAQLELEPLWIRGDKQKKLFDLSSKSKGAGKQQGNTDKVEFIEDQHLITSLETLKIGDITECDDDGNDAGSMEDGEKTDDAYEEFYERCWSFLTRKPTTSSAVETSDKSAERRRTNETITKMEIETSKEQNKQFCENEKLNRIRNKFSQKRMKRPPIMIEAKPLPSHHDDKVVDSYYDDFKETFSEWCGPETIRYLRCHSGRDSWDCEDRIVTDVERIIAQFYGGDPSINEKTVAEDIFLPPVDNVDQAKQRLSVLVELLKPSWRLLEGKLGVNRCGQRALKIVSTFRLSATNIVLDRRECNLAVAIIFRLLACCDNSLMDFFPSDVTLSSRFTDYLDQIGCDVKCFFKILSIVMDNLK